MTTPAHITSSRSARIALCSRSGTGGAGSGWRARALVLLAGLFAFHAAAAETVLEDIKYSSIAGDNVQIALRFSSPPPEAVSFAVDNPARIALDFSDTRIGLDKRSETVGIGAVRSINAAEAEGRTRVVINLSHLVGYQQDISGNELILTVGEGGVRSAAVAAGTTTGGSTYTGTGGAPTVTGVDFQRGTAGEGRIIVTLSNPNVPVDIKEQGGRVILDVPETALASGLQRRMDVVDFATPVTTIDAYKEGRDVRLVISSHGDWEHLAYQTGKEFTVEVREVPKAVSDARKQALFEGQRLSLNFQDIETRSVLQLIADFTGLNLVVSDSVGGSLTLRLKNVPWDQALDIILKTKGLAMRKTGNVLLIAPSEEIAAREKLELEAQQQVEELAPTHTEFVQVNYARAADIAALLKAPENSLLSERGRVGIDTRTNTLLVQDTVLKLEEIRNLVERLDVPVRQVLIESRIVTAEDNFSKELGVRFGVTNIGSGIGGANSSAISGTLEGANNAVNGRPVSLNDGLNVNLPVVNPAGSFGLALAKLPLGYMVQLELSAAQAEERVEIVSTPRVITSNQTQARIERGTEIPYQEASSSGATSTSFKKAVLSLEVTPTITPDDRIFLDLSVTKDDVGEIFNGVPSIDTRAVQTQVLVDNGQTVVLGGIYDTEKRDESDSVPFLGDIPLVGRLFRTDFNQLDKSELLIFITPKIIQQNVAVGP
ncbi:MAG: type IV pilus secretin PilQ [Pseudomonadota bacterium]|nr:type IV pilus secretin PilQ [Pseudomonadota bacterium]